ncbi:MotA/TolQ/ExbB proton channel family protein [Geminicoccus roseus]|uniref:MotA/TolQ/ExbB proton channel family protein n=1 Tax=Geminicoccus roseus TaxID=404900 RepID=UPI0003FF0B1A|nr:MotA/TolQ/ExbB proton channel family protein [Geminicoccus roseus]
MSNAAILPQDRPAAVPVAEHRATWRWMIAFRFLLINLVGLALVAAAWMAGLLDPIFATDSTHLVKLIVTVFVVGLVWAAQRAFMLARELNALDQPRPTPQTRVGDWLARIQGRDAAVRANLAGALKLKLAQRIATVRHVANVLVLLGLIGTVLGFIQALSGVQPDTVGDVAAIPGMVSRLLEGMSTALYTTLVGSALNIWLILNYRLLEAGSVHLLSRLVERGESNGRV